MDVKIKAPDLGPLTAHLDDVAKRQVPFALSTALNEVLYTTRQGLTKAMSTFFRNPTPLTMNSVLYKATRKTDTVLAFVIFIQDEFSKGGQGNPPVKYLFAEVEGGERASTRFERALEYAGLLPKGMAAVLSPYAPKDAYGNFSGSYIQVLSQVQATNDKYQRETERSRKRNKRDTRYFVGRPGGGKLPLGIYQRMSQGVKPIFIFTSRKPSYRPRFPFYAIVQGAFDAQFKVVFAKNLQRALDTAK